MGKSSLKSLYIQTLFIQKLREVLPPNLGLAEEMAELLELSTDSAYRRIRGETELSIDEVYKLVTKYNVSLDGLFSSKNDSVTFNYTKLTDSAEHMNNYLNRIFNHVRGLSAYPEKRITYLAGTFPLFYSFNSRKLTEFKLFYWHRSVVNVPEYQGKSFEPGIIPDAQIDLAMSTFDEYKRIPSTEVWNNETILTNIKQLEFYVESGAIRHIDLALGVLTEMRRMIDYVELSVERGSKTNDGDENNLRFYCSDVELGTNCIVVEAGSLKHAYISFNTVNSLSTNNAVFCEEMDHWVKNLVQKSTLISRVAEKQRFRFFSSIRKQLDDCESRIKAH